ncbi:MAG: YitT family protein [Prevotella sp.]|uniref:YitT family protein n=1 Tax=Prevotella sp. P3-122 TaxID=2024223 RepID=UPI000B96F260|nr:YitT family protein [Prevotella sp. P3-122]MCI6182369.1 YitT family protein [Prevotella sp.]MCI6309707.1 YitT family protein [Prevotella sp.]MCI6463487.1 YitT family protein [Prevotella sp.]MCI6554434.1 YitT family protein [Prevotella sp.]MCI7341869.1 YitT family protein [Prevotella sp.]
MTRQDIIYEIKDYFYITLGLLLYTFGFTVFLLPYEIVTGGIAGIGAIVFYSTGFPVQYTFFIINAVLIILALKTLGWKFLTKTIYATIMLTIMLEVAQTFTIQADGTFHKLLGENNDFMSLVIGCTITGTALATVFLNNGSTGGTDIVAAVLNKFHNISLGKALIIVDFCIIGSCIFVDSFGTVDLRFRKVVFGLCTMLIECLMLDYVMYWQRQSVQFLIFSKKYQEIAYAISRTTDHTLTILDGHGFWTGKPTKVLCLLAKKRESVHIFRLIKQIDPNAFVSQSSVIGVYGEGFDEMKVKIKPSNKETITTVNNENNISNKQRA